MTAPRSDRFASPSAIRLDLASDRDKTTAILVGRIAIGSAMTLFPKLAMGGWIGRQRAADPGVQAIVRALGIRDAVIGVGGLLAHRKGDQDQSMWWLRFGALSDLVDAIATWKARRSLPHSAKGVAAFATTAAATQLILSTHDRS